jgi:glycosyltransferase involved in cell wall biosynthesis
VNLAEITPLILTFDEGPNICRSIERLSWAADIVVVDSFSTDGTADLVSRFPQARLIQRRFDTFANQCNFGLQQISTPWVLSLDADYVLPPQLLTELERLETTSEVAGYRCAFRYLVHGRALRASLYPPRIILYRRDRARYQDDGHGHRVQVIGKVVDLYNKIDHDDRKPFRRWLASENKYADLEVEKLHLTSASDLGWKDRLRKRIIWAPPLAMLYCLFGKGLILDGWKGIFYTMQRVYAELLLSLKLLEKKLQSEASSAAQRQQATTQSRRQSEADLM